MVETKVENCDITPQALWLVVKLLTKRDGPKAPTAVHGPLGIILWRNRPMREVITFRNLKERDCATVPERCRVLSPLPSFRVLLGYAVITWSHKRKEGRRELSDVTRNNTQRCVLHVSDSSVDRRDGRQCSASC
jgi:hypothetical protein